MSCDKEKDAEVYPSRWAALANFATLMTRAPFLTAVVARATEPLYHSIVKSLRLSDDWTFTVVCSAAHTLTYVGVNTFYSLCDYYGWFKKHKLPRKQSQLPSRALVVATLRQAVISQLTSPFVALMVHRHLVKLPPQETKLPSLLMCTLHISMATLTNEVLFYTAHRILHEFPFLYQNIHKQHHKYVGSISIAAEYAALPEEIFGASIPTMIYMLLVKAPNPLFFWWICLRLFETYESHSGYCFKDTWLSKIGLLNAHRAEFHDYHHTANVGNFGVGLCMDYILQTMTPYLKSKQQVNDETQ